MILFYWICDRGNIEMLDVFFGFKVDLNIQVCLFLFFFCSIGYDQGLLICERMFCFFKFLEIENDIYVINIIIYNYNVYLIGNKIYVLIRIMLD